MSQRRRSVLLVGVLALSAAGCELVANFDRSEIDAGPIPSVDGSVVDASTDGATKDVNQPDTTLNDAGPDTNVPDTNLPDTNGPDSTEPDTGTDAGVDANVPDTNVPDTNVADTNAPDTNVADTNVPDTNAPDSACNALDPSAAPAVTTADSASGAPAFSGGTFPTSGTWHLTDVTFFFPDGGASGQNAVYHRVVTFSAGGYELAETKNGVPSSSTIAVSNVDAAAGTFSTNATCGAGGSASWMYVENGNGTGATLQVSTDGVEVFTYTQL